MTNDKQVLGVVRKWQNTRLNDSILLDDRVLSVAHCRQYSHFQPLTASQTHTRCVVPPSPVSEGMAPMFVAIGAMKDRY